MSSSISELLQFLQRQLFDHFLMILAINHNGTNGAVSVSESQPFADQIIRYLFAFINMFDLHRRDHLEHYGQARQEGIQGIKERLFVFLHVFVVSQKQAFHRSEQ